VSGRFSSGARFLKVRRSKGERIGKLERGFKRVKGLARATREKRNKEPGFILAIDHRHAFYSIGELHLSEIPHEREDQRGGRDVPGIGRRRMKKYGEECECIGGHLIRFELPDSRCKKKTMVEVGGGGGGVGNETSEFEVTGSTPQGNCSSSTTV